MYRYSAFCIFFCFFILIFSSCEKIKPPVQVPSYIHIDSIGLSTLPGQGSSSHKITDAWVYVDNQIIGVFEVPVTFPVLAEGMHTVSIRGGILVNGIAETRTYYPFYSFYEQSVTLSKNNILNIQPVVAYFSQITFAWEENFDKTGITLEKTLQSDTSVQLQRIQDKNVFEGNGSLYVSLNSGNAIFECASIEKFVIPKKGTPVYLELNFRCNFPVTTGVYLYDASGQSTQYQVAGLNPTGDTWKKIYINLTDAVSSYSDAVAYKVFFKMKNDNAQANLQLYLDNIKLVFR